jgi:hypothetical protein
MEQSTQSILDALKAQLAQYQGIDGTPVDIPEHEEFTSRHCIDATVHTGAIEYRRRSAARAFA